MDSNNGLQRFLVILFLNCGARRVVGSDINDTDFEIILPQKLTNKMREFKTYILILSFVCLKREIDYLDCNTRRHFIDQIAATPGIAIAIFSFCDILELGMESLGDSSLNNGIGNFKLVILHPIKLHMFF